MKIRHKQSGVVLEGQFCTVNKGYMGANQSVLHYTAYVPTTQFSKSEYSTDEWEAVAPEPEWVDVTHECTIDREGDLTHRETLLTVDEWPLDGYRMRKIALMYSDQPEFAFIIEQRQP